jgi:hypothetical protein
MTIKLNLLNNADFKNVIKIVDTLEQRISTLEKVLASHAKTIGELRGKDLSELTPDEFAKQVRFK